jgi:hypothetical protein
MKTTFLLPLALFLGMDLPGAVVVEPTGATVAGKTIGEWSALWWQWAAALAPPGDPFTDTTGAFAEVNQAGPVFFLAGSPGGSNRRQFEVPTNTCLLVPLLASEWSQLELGFDQTATQIRQAAQQLANKINSLHATLDGTAIAQATLLAHRETSPDFSFVAAANNPVGILAVGNSGIAVADGYFLMLDPLPPGTHVLKYGGGMSAYGVSLDETDTITVTAPLPPAIVTQPVGQTVDAGQNAGFTVTATGYPLRYQWRKDGVDLPGATEATLNLLSVQAQQAGGYTVVVSNSLGSVTSAPPAILKVNSASAATGAVVAWGQNSDGQTTVPAAAQSGVTAIAAGGYHTVALKGGGSVVAWGNNSYGQTTVPAGLSGVVAISAGAWHTVALKGNGAVVAWGAGAKDLGSFPDYGQSLVPSAAQNGVVTISAGGFHTVALKANGSVVAWGRNTDGQTTVPVAAQSGVIAIAGGILHTVALKRDGSLLVWGDNTLGQTAVPQAARSGVTAIASGGFCILALRTNGAVVAWGDGSSGQTTVPLAAQSGVMAVATGGDHSLALKSDGRVLAWGYNSGGQIVVPAGLNWVMAVAAGLAHSVALRGAEPVAPVTLAWRPSGNTLLLSWPTNAVGFTLQSTPSLAPPVTWMDATNPHPAADGQFVISNSISAPARFYRLRRP